MMLKYDVVIVGAGPMGIYCAYELMIKNPKIQVLLVDKGHDIYNRRCPILEHKIDKCPVDKSGYSGCKPGCSMTTGFGGAGAYSDGKYNITNEFGGWLNEYMSSEELLDLIKYVDKINLDHGANVEITDPYTEEVRNIEKRAIAVGLKLLRGKVRHLGTEENLQILKNLYEHMKDNINYMFTTKVDEIIVEDDICKGIILANGEKIEANNVVLGVGREGSEWLEKVLMKHKITFKNNPVDIGVRVETNDIVMEEINKNLYEGKFVFQSSVGTTVRTFCANPSGHVVVENQNGTIICNGHSFRDLRLGTHNTNFALLVSHEFREPFNNPNQFAHSVAQLANMLSDGGVLVQRYGDIVRGRRSTAKRIREGFVQPTLTEAVPGDLQLALPYNTMKSLMEMMEALNHVTPGIASDHTLFYGVEAKFYSARPEVDNNFETKIKNLFVGGDGAGLTRGLAQAGANGVHIARTIIKKNII
ncbi:MAG: NAD(P)/FAD-dependent oxidoreductase [Bacilli bacterium]|nr:NAD(P)/FAD-dependent oxidoreductase [Bacilli bacterium]MDD3120803.1 NAD(P)/FAD-dependent oxidoreductase [Bacilli bacterium]MDD4062998.1 NAD(P)/FAD-dependent oxidoreductase [Bacilli bacterium]MDD4481722.1 NAD(P)/FAD-dependent oxidoreductase [Bacilli bacterium]MDY0363771.1 NAD(P)/FAD-dependent oxidoreductase [Bacilli bacterium]